MTVLSIAHTHRTTMFQHQTPYALTCEGSLADERLHNIFTVGGFRLLPPVTLADVFSRFTDDSILPATVVASVQDGGLPLAETLCARQSADPTLADVSIVLIDYEDAIDVARRALRLRIADYLRVQEPDEILIAQVRKLAQAASMTTPPAEEESVQPQPSSHLQWDASIAAIFSGGTWLQLSPIEWRLFEMLLQRRGQAVASIDLIRGPLGRTDENPTTSSLLRLHMSRMRAKVGEHSINGLNIVTVRGRGYMLI